MRSDPAVPAAGGVLWKLSPRHGLRIALVHRPRYDDWSLPKGKATRGESAPQTAAREVQEETGFRVAIGRSLAEVRYAVSGGTKTVRYFAARHLDGTFEPNDEVDRLEWLTLEHALDRLSYPFDRAVLETFAQRRPDLQTVVLVRHARAGSREAFDGDDEQRPLDAKGRKQAQQLRRLLLPFAPHTLVTAPAKRCRQTIRPLATALDLPIDHEASLGEEVYRDDPAAAVRRILGMVDDEAGAGTLVACSQGGVIPGTVKTLAARAALDIPDVGTPKAAHWLLAFDGHDLVQADRYPAPTV